MRLVVEWIDKSDILGLAPKKGRARIPPPTFYDSEDAARIDIEQRLKNAPHIRPAIFGPDPNGKKGYVAGAFRVGLTRAEQKEKMVLITGISAAVAQWPGYKNGQK